MMLSLQKWGGVSGFESGNYVSVSLKPNFNQLKRTRAEIGTSFMEEPGTGIFNPFGEVWRLNIFVYKDTLYNQSDPEMDAVRKLVLRDSIHSSAVSLSDFQFNYKLEKGSTYHFFALLQKTINNEDLYKLGYQTAEVYRHGQQCSTYIPTIEYSNPNYWKELPKLANDSWENADNQQRGIYYSDYYKSVFVDGKYGDAYYAHTQIFVNNTYESVNLVTQLEFKRFLSFIRIASDNTNDLSCTLKGENPSSSFRLPIGLKYNIGYSQPFETIWSDWLYDSVTPFYSHNVESGYEFTYNSKRYKTMLNAFLFPALDRNLTLPIRFIKGGHVLAMGDFYWPSINNTFSTIIPADGSAFTIGNVGLQNATVLSGFN